MEVSKHYQQDRMLRENIIQFIGGEGNIIKVVRISAREEVFITDNCVAIFHNPLTDTLITKYVLSETQLLKYYANAPSELIAKARKYHRWGCGKF